MTELTEPEDEYPEAASTYRTTKPEVYLPVPEMKTLPVKNVQQPTSSGILKLRRGLRFCSENS